MIYYNKINKSVEVPALQVAAGVTVIVQLCTTKAVSAFEAEPLKVTAARAILGVDLSGLPAGEYNAYLLQGSGWTLGAAKSDPMAMTLTSESGEAALLADLCPACGLLKIEGDAPAMPSVDTKPLYYVNN